MLIGYTTTASGRNSEKTAAGFSASAKARVNRSDTMTPAIKGDE